MHRDVYAIQLNGKNKALTNKIGTNPLLLALITNTLSINILMPTHHITLVY